MISVLLIEDDPLYAGLIHTMSSRARKIKYDLRDADTLSKALQLLEDQRFDVILADLGLPDSSGLDTLRSVLCAAKSTPVIVLTGSDSEQLEMEALRKGAQDYLLKTEVGEPLLTRSILNAIERKMAENSFIQSEKRYRILFETANDAIFLLDGHHFVDCNRTALEMFGCASEEILGKCPWDFSADVQHRSPSRGRITDFLEEVSRGTPQFFEWQGIGKNGIPIDTEVSLNSLEHEGKVFIQCVIRDVTNRKKIEKDYRASEERYRLLTENATDMIAKLNPDGVIDYISPGCRRFGGYKPGDLVGRNIYGIVHPEHVESLKNFHKRVLNREETDPIQYRMSGLDEKWYWVESEANLLFSGTSRYAEVISISRNITKRKEAEDALRESDQRFRQLIENAPDGIYVQTQGNYRYLNKAALQIFGAGSTDELLGRPFMDRIHPDYREAVKERSRLVTEEKKNIPSQDQVYLKLDGTPLDVEVSVVPIRDEGQDGALVFIKDITQRKMIERALKISESNTRSIFENAPLPIVVARVSDGKILIANRRVAELFGMEYEKATNIPMTQYFDDKNFRKMLYSQLIENGSVDGIEANPRKVSGERIWVLLSVVLSRFQGENVIITSFSDITSRKRIEDHYRMLSDKSLAGVYVVQDGVFKYLNTNAASYAGYSPEELIGRSSFSLVHPKDKDSARKHSSEMLKGIRQTPYEFRIIDTAGRVRWILETVTIIPHEGRQAILGNSMDISQLKEAQQKLEELQALESSILAAIPHAVLGIENRRIIFANEGVDNVFGWNREELISKGTRILFRSDEAYENFGTALYTTLEKKKMVSGEYDAHFRHKDGRNLICRVTASRIGETLTDQHITTTIEDVTALRGIQMQLLQSEKMSSIGQLAAGVAHEINNPTGYVSSNLKTLEEYFHDINSVLSKYEALLDGVKEGLRGRLSPGSLSDHADAIESVKEKIDLSYILNDVPNLIQESRQGTERIRNIVIDLKNFAHPGKAEFELADIAKNIESTLNVVWNELKYKATIHKDYGDLPPVMCIPQQLNQVFMNILVNAAHAIKDKGDITIKTRRQDGHVEIAIRDTGCGIPKANIPNIFDPFFTTKEVGKGTGLGLNVAYNIIKKHHGSIDVTSNVGEGTTFTILLPVNQEAEKV